MYTNSFVDGYLLHLFYIIFSIFIHLYLELVAGEKTYKIKPASLTSYSLSCMYNP